MLFGLSRRAATEFSFFLAIPTLFAACAYELCKDATLLSMRTLPAFGVGFVAAFVSAFLCVRWLIRYVSASRFRAVRVVPDRVRRGDPGHRVRRLGPVG